MIHDFLLTFHRNYVQRYFSGTRNLKWATWRDRAPFRDSLSSVGWDLLWSTCTPNLVYMFTHYEDMKSNAKCGHWVVLELVVTKDHQQCHHLIEHTRLPIWICTAFELQWVTCQKLPILINPTCIWCRHWGDLVWFSHRPLVSENHSPWLNKWSFLCDLMSNCFDTIPTCDRQTGRQTDTWRQHISC